MREIKFRAWMDGKMYQNVGVVGNIVVIEYESDEAHDDVNLEPTYYGVRDETIKIMQYTGIKDKSSREIYEGDVVRHASDDGVYKVIFEDGGFYVKSLIEYDFQTINEYPLEVIGNIYENPELLESEE